MLEEPGSIIRTSANLSRSPASSLSVFTSWVCVTFLSTRLDWIPRPLIRSVRRITRLRLWLWRANPRVVNFSSRAWTERWWRLIAPCDKTAGSPAVRSRSSTVYAIDITYIYIYIALSRICLPDTIVVAAPLVRKRDWITTLTCYCELRFQVTRYVSRDESDVPSTWSPSVLRRIKIIILRRYLFPSLYISLTS